MSHAFHNTWLGFTYEHADCNALGGREQSNEEHALFHVSKQCASYSRVQSY